MRTYLFGQHILKANWRLTGMALLVGVTGCGLPDSATELDSSGPPEVKQIFMEEQDPKSGAPDFALAYGTHPKRTKDAQEALNKGFKLDDGVLDRALPHVLHVRVVVSELLKGETIEGFMCACSGIKDGCPQKGGVPVTWAVKEADCPDAAETKTINEAGKWLDANLDGLPDDAVMIPELAQVTCGTLVDWKSDAQGGWYNPSGNQQVPSNPNTLEPHYGGLGPAVVFTPPDLPTGQSCKVTFKEGAITDKDGEKLVIPAVDFKVAPLTLMAKDPGAYDPEDPLTQVKEVEAITLSFNTPIDSKTIAGVTVKEVGTSTEIPGEAAAVEGDNLSVAWTPTDAASLQAGKEYKVTVGTAIKDVFGFGLPAEYEYTFKIKASQ
ncbi:MAG: Ig-like domain-containing protein [Deltaproteobacteria bacterium]|nr:Ig-like domain-containing protein [Deltaproteobacteria bacterium]